MEEKLEDKPYPTFDQKSIERSLAESTTYDIILSNNEKKPEINASNNNKAISNSKFVEMPLQLTNSKIKLKQPYLIVEDKGFNKNENFRNYEISLMDEKNERKIKCYRRFSNFDSLNLKIREKYPYIILPSLPKKNYKVKLINVEEEFYESRTRYLRTYINYIFRHEVLKDSIEFNKFLNDAEFVNYV
jgi:hypothetical protein